jgi:hypothetical protein
MTHEWRQNQQLSLMGETKALNEEDKMNEFLSLSLSLNKRSTK